LNGLSVRFGTDAQPCFGNSTILTETRRILHALGQLLH
jgi:hypothetical protein